MNREQTEFLLKQYGIRPRKEQGQNFLIDDGAIEASIEGAHITTEDTILEIGPGVGALTAQLAQTGARVVAVEQDRDVMPALNKLAAQFDNLTIYNEDIRTFHVAQAGIEHRKYKVVANLPYNITSWIMRHFLENEVQPELLVTMVQKEVAERITAEPGQMSVLAVAVQAYADAEIIRIVPPESFIPAPKVDSAIIRIVLRDEPISPHMDEYMRLVRVGFASKRKQLHNNLQSGLQLSANDAKALLEDTGFPQTIRPQELSPRDWEILRKAL